MKKFEPPTTAPAWQHAVDQGEALVRQWDSLPLRELGAVRARLQSIVVKLAALAASGTKLEGVRKGSALDTLIRVESERQRGRKIA
jgi:hypothetical protein